MFFGSGVFEIVVCLVGFVKVVVVVVVKGEFKNVYVFCCLSGYYCLFDWLNGFCLFNNIGIVIEVV